jgi:5'-nucleotidase/UDP-sugar diphosphatase
MRVSSGTRQKSVNPLVAAGKALTCDSRPLYRPDVRVQEIEPNPSGSFRRLWIPVEANSGEKGDLPDREDALHSFDEETFGSRRTRGVRNPRVRILHVNDAHHAHFGPFPLDDGPPAPLITLHRKLEEERHAAAILGFETIYLSAGDEHTGTSLDELLGYDPAHFATSAAFDVQSALGLDAATIGNHDLDRGPRILEEAIRRSASFPLLSASITDSSFLTSHVPAIIGETRRGTRIGVIGVTTDEQLQVRIALDPTFHLEDPVPSVMSWSRILSPAVDVLIVLSHLGLNVPGSRHVSRVDDRVLAEALATEREARLGGPALGPDVPPLLIIGGHTHTVIDPQERPVTVRGIPIFQAGCNLSHLGVVDVAGPFSGRLISGRLVPLGRSTTPVSVTHSSSTPSSPGPVAAPPELAALHTRTIAALSRAAARRVAGIRHVSDGSISTTLEDRLTGECAIANMITDAIREAISPEAGSTIIVATDASGIQSGIREDRTLRIDDLYRILPYADSLFRAELTAAQLLQILESNARRLLDLNELSTRGGPVGLLDWAHIARGFLHFSGNLRYQVCDRGDDARVKDVTIDGIPVDAGTAGPRITLYCNSFSAMGNQGWGLVPDDSFRQFGGVSLPEMGFRDTGRPVRQVLIHSLEGRWDLSIAKDGRLIQLAPLVTDQPSGA